MFTLQIGRRTINHLPDLAAVSAAYSERRNAALALGNAGAASRMPEGVVMAHGGEQVGRVSYNGRIWPIGDWVPDMTPIYDNRVAA